MFYLFRTLPWVLTGAALYHLGCTLWNQRPPQNQGPRPASRRQDADVARHQRLYRLAIAGQRGALN